MTPAGYRERDFERTVRAYGADLYRFAYSLCRDRFGAEDLVQEALARAWKGWEGLREPAAMKAWLFTIVRNEHARTFARKRVELVDADVYELDVPDLSAAAGSGVDALLAALPLAYREPLVLQVLGGFSCKEIAEMLDTTEGAVMTRLCRARQALRGGIAGVEKRKTAK
jgi:RNA polymerase sigma-70 factor (ECF subfamily)